MRQLMRVAEVLSYLCLVGASFDAFTMFFGIPQSPTQIASVAVGSLVAGGMAHVTLLQFQQDWPLGIYADSEANVEPTSEK
jgi:hypothetical protein